MDTPPSLPLAAFRARSFRFQWPADLVTSWANEMEILILAWYVLVRTDCQRDGAITVCGEDAPRAP